MLVELFLFIAALALLFYRWARRNVDFFEKRGIPYQKPAFLFGGMKDVIFRKKSFFDVILDAYRESDAKIYGWFDQCNPITVIKDPEIIKQITVKDFDHFVNHRSVFTSDDTDLFASSLFFMKDARWKDMRSTLTPIFTSSKLRGMFLLMNEVAKNTMSYLKAQPGIDDKNGLDLNIKDFCTRFTNDIIASTAFGLQINSFTEKENKFYLMGKQVTNFTGWQTIKFFLLGNFRWIIKLFNASIFDKAQSDYFMRLVLDAMKYRKENNITRPDMIQMLMEARGIIKSDQQKTHNREWTDTEIVAQCFIFFFAGFETTSLLMCFALHELMENPDAQQKLFEEIDAVSKSLEGKPIDYETLMGMKYLDMVTSETLRKWPPNFLIDRVCNKDYVYESEGVRLDLKANDVIWMITSGLNRDAKYFENPDKFDPERFSDDNKQNLPAFVYFPFGLGPRACIGNRFALLEAKALIFYLIQNYRIEAAANTTTPLVLNIKTVQMQPTTGFWLKLVSRSNV